MKEISGSGFYTLDALPACCSMNSVKAVKHLKRAQNTVDSHKTMKQGNGAVNTPH